MVNHIRTLLMNESASSFSDWYCDGTFAPLQLSGEMASFSSTLFNGASGIGEKAKRVDSLMPFVLDPEFSDIRSQMDGRSTVDGDRDGGDSMGTVASFYKGISRTLDGIAVACVSSHDAQRLFRWDGSDDGWYVYAMSRLKSVFTNSKETSKRFSSCLLAYVVRLEKMRLRSISRSPQSSMSPVSENKEED